MHYVCAPNRPLRNTSLLPTGHWGTAAFDNNTGHVKHAKHWKPSRGALMCNICPYDSTPMSVLWGRLPTGQWGTPSYSQPATEKRQLYGEIGHIKHWKPCLIIVWGPRCVISGQIIFPDICIMCDTPNRPLRNTLLQTGHWGTAAFDCNMGGVKHTKHWKPSLGPRCVMFDHIIQSRCLSYEGDSQPASEEHPLLPTGHWGRAAVWGDRAH